MRGLENQSVGQYQLIREVGRGSMGTVYLGRDTFTLRDVAVKVEAVRDDFSDRMGRRRRKLFMNEIKAAGMLRHPNIVATYDAGIENDVRYIVMEYLPGSTTLDEHCSPKRLLPVEQAVQVVLKCALALGYAHERGVIHRDIKPKNIMLTQDREVKVCDFGVALITNNAAEETQVMGTLGSPRYMSPEQVVGDTSTNQSDIFSLGIVFYELLTGVNPFAAKTMPQIARLITRTAHKPVREVRSGVPPEVSQIVDRMLKKHPAGRYRQAMDLAGDLSLVHDELRTTQRDHGGRDRLERVRKLRFFESFEESDIEELLGASEWQTFEPGARILLEGDRGDSFYILVDGEVSVRRGSREVDRLQQGASFGEIGFIIKEARTASIIARRPSTVLKVDAHLIDRSTIGCQLRFQKAFLRMMAERLNHAMGYIAKHSSS